MWGHSMMYWDENIYKTIMIITLKQEPVFSLFFFFSWISFYFGLWITSHSSLPHDVPNSTFPYIVLPIFLCASLFPLPSQLCTIFLLIYCRLSRISIFCLFGLFRGVCILQILLCTIFSESHNVSMWRLNSRSKGHCPRSWKKHGQVRTFLF